MMNEKVKGFAIKDLQNQEHFGFVTEVKLALTRAALEPLNPFVTRLTPLLEEEDKGLELIAKSEYTKQIAQLDKTCDNIYKGLSRNIQAETYSPVPEDAAAARLLKIVLDTYGYFINGSYETQHGKTINLIQDMRNAKYKPAADRINVTRWVDWMATTNDNFIQLFRTRRDEKAEASIDYRPLRLVRKDVDALYRETVTHINAMAILQPSEALSDLIARINVHIDRLSAIMESRRTRSANKK